MKIIQLLFLTVTFTVVEAMVLAENHDGAQFEFPELQSPDPTYKEIESCSSIEGCIKYIGHVLYNIGVGIISAVQFIFYLSKFVFQLFALLITLIFTGVEGAPWYVNLVFYMPLVAGTSIIVYRLIRQGESST